MSHRRLRRAGASVLHPVFVSSLSLAFSACLLLYAAGRPIDTNDFWWHLKMGSIHAGEGPRLTGDPLTHTALPGAPPSGSWLFDLTLYGLHQSLGFFGLRVVHALLVLAALWLAFAIFRRTASSTSAACLATLAFLILGWFRFFQFRPDLVSIPATLLLYRLVLDPHVPRTPPRAGAALVLLALWANLHALYGLGLCLLLAALLGCALQRLFVLRGAAPSAVDPGAGFGRAPWIAAILVLGSAATLLNPWGLDLHSTFFRSSETGAIWRIEDDWGRFSTIGLPPQNDAVNALVAVVANGILLLFAWHACRAALGLVRGRPPDSRSGFDPVLFGLGVAGSVAMLAAVRFLWLGFFPLVCLLHANRTSRASARVLTRSQWMMAIAATGLAIALVAGFRTSPPTGMPDRSIGLRYFALGYNPVRFHGEGVRFLAATELEGNLYNHYSIGGFLGYWLNPKLRTFIDGRMNVPDDVFRDAQRIQSRLGGLPGEAFTEALDRRNVDVFFGVDLRWSHEAGYTTASHLEREPGWVLVFRSFRTSIYLRANERNRANMQRIEDFWQRLGVDFDASKGVDVLRIVRSRPTWAAKQGLVPPEFPFLLQASTAPDPAMRVAALGALAEIYSLLGAYPAQIDIDREIARRTPNDKDVRRRLVYGLLRLDQPVEAMAQAQALLSIDPEDPVSSEYLRLVRRYLDDRASTSDWQRARAGAAVDALPLRGYR